MIANILERYFVDFDFSETSPCKTHTHISELIVAYLPSPPVYDRPWFAARYAERYWKHPLKSKPLKICYMDDSEQNRERFKTTVQGWQSIGTKYLEKYKKAVLQEQEPVARQRLELGINSITALMKMSLLLTLVMKPSYRSTAVFDENNQIQAVSISKKDPRHQTAWEIAFLITAPHNLRGVEIDEEARVSGAATALIEEAIIQSLKHKGVSPIACTEGDLRDAAVRVASTTSSRLFYEKLYFAPDEAYSYCPDNGNKILTGGNVLRFLNQYGGRAAGPLTE